MPGGKPFDGLVMSVRLDQFAEGDVYDIRNFTFGALPLNGRDDSGQERIDTIAGGSSLDGGKMRQHFDPLGGQAHLFVRLAGGGLQHL